MPTGPDSLELHHWSAHLLLCGVPLWNLGTEPQRHRYLPRLCSGEWVGGLAWEEAGSCQDPSRIQTRAHRCGDLGEAAMARLLLAGRAQEVIRDAAQLHGAAGLVSGTPLERWQRDALHLTVEGGSSDLLRSIIASSMLGLG